MTPYERIERLSLAIDALNSNNPVIQIGLIRDAFQAILDDMLERLRDSEKRAVDQQSSLAGGLHSGPRGALRHIES